jgi:FkbM family methyltransferase
MLAPEFAFEIRTSMDRYSDRRGAKSVFSARIKDGLHFEVPDNLRKIYTDFEPCTTKSLLSSLHEGDVFLDIGANFGFFSILAASIVGPSGRVYAVEASPSVLPILSANTKKYENIVIIESAAGNRTGTTEFFMTEDFVNSGVVQSPFIDESKRICVGIDKLDNLLRREPGFDGRLNFIKCDVQGDEVPALEGLREIIEANGGLKLIAEWAPAWMNNAGYDAREFPSFLRSLGFTEIVVVDDYLNKQMSLEEMEQEFRADTSGKRFCNVLASK